MCYASAVWLCCPTSLSEAAVAMAAAHAAIITVPTALCAFVCSSRSALVNAVQRALCQLLYACTRPASPAACCPPCHAFPITLMRTHNAV
jgi:hypothetical protein